jgi:hypothetical protein
MLQDFLDLAYLGCSVASIMLWRFPWIPVTLFYGLAILLEVLWNFKIEKDIMECHNDRISHTSFWVTKSAFTILKLDLQVIITGQESLFSEVNIWTVAFLPVLPCLLFCIKPAYLNLDKRGSINGWVPEGKQG